MYEECPKPRVQPPTSGQTDAGAPILPAIGSQGQTFVVIGLPLRSHGLTQAKTAALGVKPCHRPPVKWPENRYPTEVRVQPHFRAPLAFSLGLTLLVLAPAWAQDPVTKPRTEPGVRLPAPKPTARQLPDGRIELTWPALEGAVRYDLWRSVPPAGQVAITRPNPEATTYIDSDVRQGSTYYYLVAAVGEDGTSGLRGGSPPVTATRSAGTTSTTPTATAPQSISARLLTPGVVEVSYSSVSGATGYRLERIMFRALASNPAQMDPASQQVSPLPTSGPPPYVDNVGSQPYPRWVQYRVTPVLVFGSPTPAVSPVVALPAATTTSGGPTTGPATTTTAPAFTGSTTLTVAAPSSLTVGATSSLAAAAGLTGARWISLNESVVTVDAAGSVTAKAAGTTQVVALSAASDGSLRVVAVPVTVAP